MGVDGQHLPWDAPGQPRQQGPAQTDGCATAQSLVLPPDSVADGDVDNFIDHGGDVVRHGDVGFDRHGVAADRGDGRHHHLGLFCTGAVVDDHPVAVFGQYQGGCRTDSPTGSRDQGDSYHRPYVLLWLASVPSRPRRLLVRADAPECSAANWMPDCKNWRPQNEAAVAVSSSRLRVRYVLFSMIPVSTVAPFRKSHHQPVISRYSARSSGLASMHVGAEASLAVRGLA